MVTISQNASSVDVINLFEAASEEEQSLVIRHLTEITEQVMERLPGFISANLHRSIPSPLAPADKFFVANYAQWENTAALEAMMQDPRARAHMREITAQYVRTGALFRLVSVHTNDGSTSTTLSEDHVTVINVFEAKDEQDQKNIMKHLTDITEQVMINLPGFVSANLHQSIPSPIAPADKFFVANYAQWKEAANLGTMMRDPRAVAHMEEITAQYPRIGALFRLVSTFHPA